MTELGSGVTLLGDELKAQSGSSWKEYTFEIDGAEFVVEGPLLGAQMELFGEPEDRTPESIDESVAFFEESRNRYLGEKWSKLKTDLGLVAVGNVIILTPAAVVDGSEILDMLPGAVMANVGVLAFVGVVDCVYARFKQKDADRPGKIAENLKRTRPYFESLQTADTQ